LGRPAILAAVVVSDLQVITSIATCIGEKPEVEKNWKRPQRSHSKKTSGWTSRGLWLQLSGQAGPSTSCHWKGRKEDKGTKKIIICLVVLVHVFTYKFSLLDWKQ
jgi:hypothetical protein